MYQMSLEIFVIPPKKKKEEVTNNYKSHVQKNGDAKLIRFQSSQNGTTKHQRGQLPQ